MKSETRRHVFHELKLVVEPGGVIGLAVLLAGKVAVKGKVVVAILSGANVDPAIIPAADRQITRLLREQRDALR